MAKELFFYKKKYSRKNLNYIAVDLKYQNK